MEHVVKLCFDVSLYVCSHLNHLWNLLRLYCIPYCSENNWTNDLKTITLLVICEVVLNKLLDPPLNISTISKDWSSLYTCILYQGALICYIIQFWIFHLEHSWILPLNPNIEGYLIFLYPWNTEEKMLCTFPHSIG